MTDEAKLDPATADRLLEAPAPHTNRFFVSRDNGLVRITFAEGLGGEATAVRAAISTTVEDARLLIDLLTRMTT